ncbi:unnamed protein product [Zymoseptoria tritici ST99CH_3D1]|nr:unnamed protein product [Zymoseptoria tritici ST99CH_3D1]
MPEPSIRFDHGATYVRSHIISPMALACLRTCIALYMWTTIITGFAWLSSNSAPQSITDIGLPTFTMLLDRAFIGRSFSYLTFITYRSLAFYFSVSAWHTFTYAFNLRRGRPESISHLHDSFPRSLQLAHAIWHTAITTLPFLVTLVFWSMMYAKPESPSSAFVVWINVSVHGLNSFFASGEIVFSATKPPPFFSHLLIVKIILALYLGLAYVTRFTQGFYPYPWMITLFGWQGIVAHVFAYGGGMTVIYALVWGAKWLRERIVAGGRARREANAHNWQMEGGKTMIGLEVSSADSSKTASLSDKSPQVELSTV